MKKKEIRFGNDDKMYNVCCFSAQQAQRSSLTSRKVDNDEVPHFGAKVSGVFGSRRLAESPDGESVNS